MDPAMDLLTGSDTTSDSNNADVSIAAPVTTDKSQNGNFEKPMVKRKASTIAEQQEAARKIQQELETRNPRPNEDENLENAVFEKVVKKPVAKKPVIKTTAAQSTASKTAPAKKKTKAWPAIEFEEMKMVFDTINQGDIIDYNFIFTNTGSAPLEIKSAAATCGCTRPSYPFIPIEPNEQGRITVTYNSVGKEGFQNPEITIKTNINSKEIVLMMEGFVIVPKKEEGSNK